MRLAAVLVTILPILAAAAPAVDYGDSCHHSITKTTTTTSAHPKTSTSSSSTSSATANPSAEPFTFIAAHSGSPIHLQAVNANGFKFVIGAGPLTYCPSDVPPSACGSGTTTAVEVGDGGASLAVEVPGGQEIYVTATGALGYTVPHSGLIPPGAVTAGFTYTAGPSFGDFGFTGLGATGFLACPSPNATAPYQVFAAIAGLSNADVPGGSVAACIGFDALTSVSGIGAWEYE
ncbi:hypothetical protein MMC19_007025 [Ptychographa xylographoides]|nr:hypothetical protein [Ptychographa xylographoides]